MDIYDSRYFSINKWLVSYIGLWPYSSKNKNRFIRIYSSIMLVIMTLPHMFGVRKNFGVNTTLFFENVGVFMYIVMIMSKLFVTALAENKFRSMYDSIKHNWETITEKKERATLIEYSERGRMLTIVYMAYMICALIVFTALPITPMILNKVKPLNKSRPHLFILNGEFPMDRDENFGKIYLFDVMTCSISVFVVMAVDTMYVVCTEHCIGLFAIVKYRLQIPNKLAMNAYSSDSKMNDESYTWVVDTIRLHNKILKFTNTIETTYSTSFLLLIGINVMFFSVLSFLILVNIRIPLNSIRYGILILGLTIHLFYISWPGQKFIDHSTGLFRDAYCNEWYEGTTKSKQLLKFFALRCSQPCLLTAGGLVNMNFENFFLIMKRSLSYLTVFSSCR